jgi:ribosomal-protein-alanine N-acetyltransferase
MRIIRSIKENDLHQIMQIEFESFSDPYPLHFFKFLAETAPDLFLVTVDKGEILGYIIADIEQNAGIKIGHLLSLAVRKDQRRTGIGHLLFRALSEVLRKRGCKEMLLEVRFSNYSAKIFYEKHGFKEFGRSRKYYDDGEDALIMRLQLEEEL